VPKKRSPVFPNEKSAAAREIADRMRASEFRLILPCLVREAPNIARIMIDRAISGNKKFI